MSLSRLLMGDEDYAADLHTIDPDIQNRIDTFRQIISDLHWSILHELINDRRDEARWEADGGAIQGEP